MRNFPLPRFGGSLTPITWAMKVFNCCAKIPNYVRWTFLASDRNPSLPVRPRSSGLTDLSHAGERCGSVTAILRSRLLLLGTAEFAKNTFKSSRRRRAIRFGGLQNR